MLYAADIGRMGAALTAFALRQDVNASILAATNAVENNFLTGLLDPELEVRRIEEEKKAAQVVWESMNEKLYSQSLHEGADWITDVIDQVAWVKDPIKPYQKDKMIFLIRN